MSPRENDVVAGSGNAEAVSVVGEGPVTESDIETSKDSKSKNKEARQEGQATILSNEDLERDIEKEER